MVLPARAWPVTVWPVTEVIVAPPLKTEKPCTIVVSCGAALWSRSPALEQ